MKIESASIRNFKNVGELFIEPEGRSFVIAGGNAAGKSSVVQALLGTLAGEKPKVVVGKDGDVAEVIVNIKGDGKSFHIAAKYQQDAIKGRAEGKIVITDQDGNKVGLKAFRYLIGNSTFDVNRDFLSKTKKEQVDFLKKVSGKEAEFNALERERLKKFEERTEVNRKVRDLEGEIKGKEIDTKLTFIDLEPIKKEMSEIGESIKKYEYVVRGVSEAKSYLADYDAVNEKIDAEISALEAKIKELKDQKASRAETHKEMSKKLEKGEAWLEANKEPDMDELNEKMSKAIENNRSVEKRDEILAKHKLLKEKKAEAESLTKEIEKKEAEKADLIKESNLPVDGLTFNEEGVFLDGLPFEEGQINTAKIQEVGFMLFKSLQNNIKVMKLDMNDLDKDTYEKILNMASESDTQVIFEKVSWDGGENPEIKFAEEYL